MVKAVAVSVVVSLAVSLAVMTALSGPASAHVALLFTAPVVDGAVPISPAELTLTFDSMIVLPADPVTVTGPDGGWVALGRAVARKSVLTVPVAQTLRPGVYAVAWQVIGDDGDVVTGRYRFAVGPRPPASALVAEGFVSPPAGPGLWPTVVLRWLVFAALAVALGGMAGARLVRRHAARASRAAPEPWVRPAATFGAVAAAGLAVIAAGGGSLPDGMADVVADLGGVLDGRASVVAAVEVVAFAAAVACRRRPRVAGLALLAVVAAEAVRGHPREVSGGWGALSIAVHLCAAALWIGALVQVVRTALAWRDRPKVVWRLVGDYARWAVWLFAAVVVSGVVAGLLVLPLGAVVTTTYGRMLLVKLALVAAAAGLALTARLRLRRIAGPAAGSAAVARAEAGALAGVLAVTALLVSVPPPLDAASPLPFPPPPSGPVLPLGALAGPVSISATASAGKDRHLRLRRCGTGCFAAPASWRTGTSQLTLRATVSGTALGTVGGSVALPVTWPPRPDAATLRRTWEAMRGVRRFTLYERVTSDTRRGPGALKKIAMNGTRFLDSEPYRANAPVVLRDGPDMVTVALPAERVQARLILDERGRIVREVLTAPRYLITRTFVYPEPEGRAS